LVHQTEKTIADLGADISETDKFDAQNAVADVKQALEGDDKDAIEQKANALQQIAMKIGEIAYRKAQEKSAGAPDTENASSPNQNTDDVLDADFTDAKDDNNKKSA
jgi:molecular chaperone DnaK